MENLLAHLEAVGSLQMAVSLAHLEAVASLPAHLEAVGSQQVVVLAHVENPTHLEAVERKPAHLEAVEREQLARLGTAERALTSPHLPTVAAQECQHPLYLRRPPVPQREAPPWGAGWEQVARMFG